MFAWRWVGNSFNRPQATGDNIREKCKSSAKEAAPPEAPSTEVQIESVVQTGKTDVPQWPSVDISFTSERTIQKDRRLPRVSRGRPRLEGIDNVWYNVGEQKMREVMKAMRDKQTLKELIIELIIQLVIHL